MGDPTGIDHLHERTMPEIDDLVSNGTTRDEVDRAREAVLADLDFVTNRDLLERLMLGVRQEAVTGSRSPSSVNRWFTSQTGT